MEGEGCEWIIRVQFVCCFICQLYMLWNLLSLAVTFLNQCIMCIFRNFNMQQFGVTFTVQSTVALFWTKDRASFMGLI